MRHQKKLIGVLAALMLVTTSWLVPTEARASETVQIVALGDSYTAGNGALSYLDRDCYRSENAYVHRYENELEKIGISAQSYNFACHGALTADIGSQMQVAGGLIATADIIMLTSGGNDAGFTQMVIDCVAVTRYINYCHDNVEQVLSQMDGIVSDLKAAIATINKAAPDAQIVLVGYPYLVASCTRDFDSFRSMQSAFDGWSDVIVSELNQIPLATAGRVTYASMIPAFSGHEVCGHLDQYVRGSVDTFPTNFAEWWHPNLEGHLAIAKELVKLGVHKRVVTSSSGNTQTSAGGSHVYDRLPFRCGVEVPVATTYDTFHYGGRTFYHGKSVDMPMPSGTAVTAPMGGVAYVRWDEYGYGRYIDVLKNGTTYRLAHLQKDVHVANGQNVRQGQVLGKVGSTGASTGPHLHIEQRSGSEQVEIDLGGPELVWSAPLTADGDRYTLHSLKSGNCGSARTDVPLAHLEDGEIRAVRADGTTQTLLSGIMTPKYRVSCDRDNNGQDEVYSAEYRGGKWFIMQMKVVNGVGKWSEWRRDFMGRSIRGLSCGDRNGDGRDELKAHLSDGGIWMLSAGGEIKLVGGIGAPVYRVECDVDRDGREEMLSLERAGTKQWRLMVANFDLSGAFKSWSRFMPDGKLGGHSFAGMSCGDRDGNGRDELKLFSAGVHKLYRVTEHKNPSDRYLAGLWGGLTTPKAMIECDVNDDGIDEFYSVEDRAEGLFIMKGTIKPLKSWSVYSVDFDGKRITDLSCGAFDLK